MDNVVQFPKFNPRVTLNETDIEDRVSSLKHHHINQTLDALMPLLFSQLDVAGFDFSVDDEEVDPYIKDGAFLVEAVRSLLCKYYGIFHPFNIIAEEVYTRENTEPGTLRVVDHLNVRLRDANEGNS